jgi:capsular exopolysaccharide synthesis family protein
VIAVRSAAQDPATAETFANFIADSFVRYNYKNSLGQITEVEDFIRSRLAEAERSLNLVEAHLAEHKRKHDFSNPSETSKKSFEKYSRLETEIEVLKIKNGENERMHKFYANKRKAFDSEVTSDVGAEAGASGRQADNVRSRIDSLRKQRAALLAQGLRVEDPTLTHLGADLREKSKQLKSILSGSDAMSDSLSTVEIQAKLDELESDSKRNSARIAALSSLLGEVRDGLEHLPESERAALNLEREAALQYELFSQLKKRLQEVELQRAGIQNSVRLEEHAFGAQPESRPGLPIRILFFLFSGLFFGFAISLVLEALNRTVKRGSDIERSGIDFLGNIPMVDAGGKEAHPLICATHPDGAESMAFKFLRAHLSSAGIDAPAGVGKVFSLISAERGAGKSFVAANLAVSYSQLGKRTALVDCDFRNPTQPKYFGYEHGAGILEVLQAERSLSSIIQASGVRNLDIFPAGMADARQSEAISDEKFKVLLSYLRTKYDYVIIDAPPALFVVDGSLIGGMADASLFVARHRSTSYEEMVFLRKKVHKLTKKPIFGVLNGLKEIHEYRNYSTRAYLDSNFASALAKEIKTMDFSELEKGDKLKSAS